MSENRPIKHAYIQQNPLVPYPVPDMNKMTVINHDTNKQVKLSNVVKRNFFRVLVTKQICSSCRIYTMNNLKDCVRASSLSQCKSI